LLQPLHKRRRAGPPFHVFSAADQNADTPDALGLLRARRGRKTRHRAANPHDEIAPLHAGYS
jgi:hypothetical protein